MSRARYMILPIGIAVVAVVYWLIAREEAGAVMLLVFAAAMALMGWVLLPTVDNVGPTAPVDTEIEERR